VAYAPRPAAARAVAACARRRGQIANTDTDRTGCGSRLGHYCAQRWLAAGPWRHRIDELRELASAAGTGVARHGTAGIAALVVHTESAKRPELASNRRPARVDRDPELTLDCSTRDRRQADTRRAHRKTVRLAQRVIDLATVTSRWATSSSPLHWLANHAERRRTLVPWGRRGRRMSSSPDDVRAFTRPCVR